MQINFNKCKIKHEVHRSQRIYEKSVLLLYNNARPHILAITQDKLFQFK